MPKTFTITVDDEFALGITVARLLANKALPQTISVPDPAFVPDPEHPDAPAPMIEVPNPELIATDEAYIQDRWGVKAARSYYDQHQDAFRFPTGEWLQRWTAGEKKQIRAIGAGTVAGIAASTCAQVQGFLDRIDASPVINLSDPDVVNGVPLVCQLLEATGVIPPGGAASRAATINALNI